MNKAVFITLLKRLSIALLAYGLLRFFFLAYNYRAFSQNSFFELLKCFVLGLRFDIAAILICNSVFIVLHLFPTSVLNFKSFRISLKAIFYISNIPAYLLNCIDIAYFRYTFKRTTADFLNLVKTGDDVGTLLPQYIKDYWDLLLLLISLIVLSEILYRKTYTNKPFPSSKQTVKKAVLRISGAVLIIFFTVIGIRGGTQYKPITILNASQFTLPANGPLVLNTPFTIIKTIGKQELTEVQYFKGNGGIKYFNPVSQYNRADSTKTNVVIIILESFGKEYFGSLNNNKGYTPFLDSLIKESLVFPRAVANGKRSIEGIPAIVASIPTLMDEPYITSSHAGNGINSIASVLHKNGYSTAFYHGGNNGTMGFDIFSKIAGFDNYYGRNEYPDPKDYDGNWGIYDEPYLQYFARNLNKEKKPFFATLFTLSSHHPYSLPPQYVNVFKGGALPIYRTVQYTDHALQQFFKTAAKMPWFNNTLFVICPDHTSLSENAIYQTNAGNYSIPIIFYQAGSRLKGLNQTTIQQTDIMPSVLDYIGVKQPFVAFGKSAFDDTEKHFGVNFIGGNYQIIQDDYALQFNGSESIGLYNYRTDSLMRDNLLAKNLPIKMELENKLKAVIQTYNYRLIHNKLLPAGTTKE